MTLRRVRQLGIAAFLSLAWCGLGASIASASESAEREPLPIGEFAHGMNTAARRGLAGGEETPPEILSWLAGDADVFVRKRVADNPRITGETRLRLSLDPDASVRGALVYGYGNPEHIFELLLADPYWDVHAQAVRRLKFGGRRPELEMRPRPAEMRQCNRRLPESDAHELAKSADVDSRTCAARQWEASPKALRRLSRDSELKVRLAVAVNGKAPAGALEALASDDSLVVRHAVAAHPDAPASVLERLAQDASEVVRARVASHESAAADLLVRLTGDGSLSTRVAVGTNPSAPRLLLAELARDPDPWVARTMALHGTTRPSTLRELARSEDERVLLAVARHVNTPLEILALLSRDSRATIRLAVARNASLSLPLAERLSQDPDPRVRGAARAMLASG